MNFKVGDRVHHAAYGDGTVIGRYGRGENVTAAVEFDISQAHFHSASTYGGKPGKDKHCWYVFESNLTPINNPSWILIVRPDKSDPDTTTAILKVDGKEVRRESVKRYHKDEYNIEAAIKAVMAKIATPVEPPKPEPVKVEPIMIGNRELKVGSKFILKPHGEVDDHHGVSKSDWGDDFGKILVVSKVYASTTPPYIDIENGCYLYCCDAIDRILED
jgi:hypothetical protein